MTLDLEKRMNSVLTVVIAIAILTYLTTGLEFFEQNEFYVLIIALMISVYGSVLCVATIIQLIKQKVK